MFIIRNIVCVCVHVRVCIYGAEKVYRYPYPIQLEKLFQTKLKTIFEDFEVEREKESSALVEITQNGHCTNEYKIHIFYNILYTYTHKRTHI